MTEPNDDLEKLIAEEIDKRDWNMTLIVQNAQHLHSANNLTLVPDDDEGAAREASAKEEASEKPTPKKGTPEEPRRTIPDSLKIYVQNMLHPYDLRTLAEGFMVVIEAHYPEMTHKKLLRNAQAAVVVDRLPGERREDHYLVRPLDFALWLQDEYDKCKNLLWVQTLMAKFRRVGRREDEILLEEAQSRKSKRGPKRKYDQALDKRIHEARKSHVSYEVIVDQFGTEDNGLDKSKARKAYNRHRGVLYRRK